MNLDNNWSCCSPLLDGHLFGGHPVRQWVCRLCRGQQVSRGGALPAQVFPGLQGEGLGLKQCLREALRFGSSLWWRVQEGLVQRLCEPLRPLLGLWGVGERFGVRRWGLRGLGVLLQVGVCGRLGQGGRRLLEQGRFGQSFRRLGVRWLMLGAARYVRHCPG